MDPIKDLLSSGGRDLSYEAACARLATTLYRDELIEKIGDSLVRERSVLLVGEAGVGKSAVVHGLVYHLFDIYIDCLAGEPHRVLELSTGHVMSGARYIGDWEENTLKLIDGAVRDRVILNYADIWNLPHAGKTRDSPSNMLELLNPKLNDKGLLLLGEITPEILPMMQKDPGFLSIFDIHHVEPLSANQIQAIAQRHADSLGIRLAKGSLLRAVELCLQFLPDNAGPRNLLMLLDRIERHGEESAGGGDVVVGSALVEEVFSRFSGLPLFVLDRSKTLKIQEIRRWFSERVVGQEQAVEAVVDSIVMFKSALNDPSKPLGTFLFSGPTGVGKTELAKALASFLFGSEQRLLRFDLSEFSEYTSFKLLIGDPSNPEQQPRLTAPVKQQPFQVVLFDELEKGHPNVHDLMLQILDEGRLSDSSGATVSFRNTFVIVTSNVGAQGADKRRIGFGEAASESDGSEKMREGLESFFRPEFLNRFQRIVPFHALRPEHVERIVRKEIALILARQGISARNLAFDCADSIISHVSQAGYDVRYGARALKREVERQIVMPIATVLSERHLAPGSILKLELIAPRDAEQQTPASVVVRVLDTAQSVAHKREIEPVRNPKGVVTDLAALLKEQHRLHGVVTEIKRQLDERGFQERRGVLEARRQASDFWQDAVEANAVLQELDSIRGDVHRLDQIEAELRNTAERLRPDCGRDTLTQVAKWLFALAERIAVCERELLLLGAEKRCDVLLMLSPIGAASEHRNELFDLYRRWAQWRGHALTVLHEPLTAEEPVFFGISGDYCLGYLLLESGIHRFRQEEPASGAVRVSAVPWSGGRCDPVFQTRVALKKTGQLGGRIRSRCVVSEPSRLVLQNQNSLEDNREVAALCATSWADRPADVDENVRRYDSNPLLIKDLLTKKTFHRVDCLKPENFHALLCQRIDTSARF